MKLKHVHLFGILLLSLVLASFLGKYIDFGKEGLENDNKETKTTNVHTGGDDVEDANSNPDADADADVIPPNTGRSAESTYGNESTVAPDTGIEGFGGLFDSILPSNSGNSLEPFISPFSTLEGLEAGSGSGITRDQIPKGQEHLYILKSQVVPPTTCPVCPSFGGKNDGAADSESGGDGDSGRGDGSNSSGLSNGLGSAFPGGSGGAGGSASKCPPCPACARCPEPSFECKKVPNYAISQNGSMAVPRPVLADFSQFGM
jgi:hypothetical protein